MSPSVGDIDSVVFADKADYEADVRCVAMPCCGFTFDACHTDDKDGPGTYSCPLCTERRLRAALEAIRDHGKTHDQPCWAISNGDCADVMQEIARAALDA